MTWTDKSKIQTLRTRIKNEMNRRNGGDANKGWGSLASYASSAYDVTTPSTGDVIQVKHGKGIIDPLVAVKDFGDLANVEQGRIIPNSFNETDITTYVNTLENESMTGANSSCRSACSGLCVATCATTCNGCSGTCEGGCQTGCSTTCGTGCTSSCGSGCAGSCSSNCSGTSVTKTR